MATRNYSKEYKREKDKKKLIGVGVTPEFFEAFTAKTELNGTNKNAVLKACAEAYTYGNLIKRCFFVYPVNELTKFTEHNRNQPQRLLVFQLAEIL